MWYILLLISSEKASQTLVLEWIFLIESQQVFCLFFWFSWFLEYSFLFFKIWKLQNMAVSATFLHLSICVCDIMNKASMLGRKVYHLTNQTFFCSSLVKSKLTWLCPEESKFEAVKYCRCINIDSMTRLSLQQQKKFVHVLLFEANLHLCLGSYLTFFS